MEEKFEQSNFRRSRVLRWLTRLWREWTVESSRPIAPAFAKPNPNGWSDELVTAAWLGHATVLINFFGTKILTDPALFPRVGIRLPGLTLGPKRLIAPALAVHELPRIDLVLLSHAHFDHFDLRTLPLNLRAGSCLSLNIKCEISQKGRAGTRAGGIFR